jgi:hypothetical protein
MKKTVARPSFAIAVTLAAAVTVGCKASQVGDAVESAGETVASGAKSVAGTASSLVNVNLSNVLNDLALDLRIDRANIPINAQIPITIAANVCGVSINILSVSTGGQANCTAKTSSAELAQAVQQQMAADGSVGGGAQTTQPATTTTTPTEPATTEDPAADDPQ